MLKEQVNMHIEKRHKIFFFTFLLSSCGAYAQMTPTIDSTTTKKLESVLSVLDTKKTSCDANTPISPISSGLCQDLAKFTCAPGSFNDGTGTITSGEIESRVDQLKQDSKSYFADQFVKTLKDPKNNYFRQLALSTLGLTNSPDCEKNPDVCNAQLAKGLTTVAIKRIFPAGGGGGQFGMYNGGGSLKDFDLLTQNPKYVELEKTFSERIKTQLDHKKALDNIRDKVFPQIKNLIEKQIQNSVADPVIRKNLLSKVDAIRFEGDNCGKMAGNSQSASISSLLIPNAFYEPATNTFTLCNGFLINGESDFQIAGIIAHELGHSIDPCGVTRGPSDFSLKYSSPKDQKKSDSEFPFTGVAECLRSSNSVHAKSLYHAPMNYGNQGKSGMGDTAEPVEDTDPTPVLCKSDQITESFADWTLSNVLPEYISKNHPELTENQYKIGYSNVFRSSCDNTQPNMDYGQDVHPDLSARINRIILVQPKIRQQMGCPVTPPNPSVYCAEKGVK
jgi:hypothetical protein